VSVEAGGTVTFVNDSSAPIWPASNIHPTHEAYPGFDPKAPVAPGGSWSFRFDRPGQWRYHNHLSPDQGGVILVDGDIVGGDAALRVVNVGALVFDDPGGVSADEVGPLFSDDDLLVGFIERYGPAGTVHLLSENRGLVGGDCHQRAHDLGRTAYALFGSAAFSLSGHECQSGAFHGATEALFRDHGASTLGADVEVICGGDLNAFFRHQCVHGVGHGLMAWTNYGLPEALALCDLLEGRTDQESCYSGTFMENVVGGLSGSMGHFTNYLSDDPHYPCNALDERYVAPCYYYQTSRMALLFTFDFQRIAAACAEAPAVAMRSCYLSMGRDVGSVTLGEPDQAIAECANVAVVLHREDCIAGAVQNSFWDASGTDDALAFCGLVEAGSAKARCYRTLIDRAPLIYATQAELLAFCARVEPGYGDDCG
jgi:hypothetical protein